MRRLPGRKEQSQLSLLFFLSPVAFHCGANEVADEEIEAFKVRLHHATCVEKQPRVLPRLRISAAQVMPPHPPPHHSHSSTAVADVSASEGFVVSVGLVAAFPVSTHAEQRGLQSAALFLLEVLRGFGKL